MKVEIDFNGDGIFEGSEIIFEGLHFNGNEIPFTVPIDALTGQSLRMRVMTDSNTIYGCVVYYGQIEDYSVRVLPIDSEPVANFSWEVIDECQGVYQFIDNSSGLPFAWNWDFGDGTTSILQNPIHIFGESGSFMVSLTSTNSFGEGLSEAPLNISASGITGIEVSSGGYVGVPINLTPVAEGVENFYWDFGDGTTLETVAPQATHTFSEEGVYQIVVATSDDVCEQSFTILLNVTFVSNDDIISKDDFVLYPNPSNGLFVIEVPSGHVISKISAFDSQGKQILFSQKGVNDFQTKIIISDPVAGMYNLLITTDRGLSFTKRVVLE
ncbi:MAG: PKD domain-containing protein [Flavobacteriales bacterium]|nr:PKD domain-containing protein [Flavobacteriales bacterium]